MVELRGEIGWDGGRPSDNDVEEPPASPSSSFSACDELESKLRKIQISASQVADERRHIGKTIAELTDCAKRLMDNLNVRCLSAASKANKT